MPADDLGTTVALPTEVRRVVSLVPSLTESIAATAPQLLVGANILPCAQHLLRCLPGAPFERLLGVDLQDCDRAGFFDIV